MENILLSPEFTNAVLSGNKVTTIRRGRRPYVNGNAVLRAGSQDIKINIKNVRFTILKSLTEDDAQRDGCPSLSELRQTLLKFYPDLNADEDLTIVEFSVTGRKNDRYKRKARIQRNTTASIRN